MKKEQKNSELIKLLRENYDINSASDIKEALKDLFKDTIQDIMNVEFDEHMGYEKSSRHDENNNYRNGSYNKKVKSTYGTIDVEVPRDRNSDFEPQMIPKHKRDISDIENQIISLYSLGLSTRDISNELNEMYGIDVSATMISNITDKILPKIRDWQTRTLDSTYPIIFIDAVHFNVKSETKIVKKAAYIVLGYDINGNKDILGIWVGENESSKFWHTVLTELKQRGVKDILILCSDGLSGIKDAINASFPQTVQQRCIVHMIRNSTKFVGYKNYKEFCKDLKTVYQASSEKEALENLELFNEKWGSIYPHSIRVWKDNWNEISHMYNYSPELRTLIYTTNAIESLNRGIRKYTKSKGSFPTDDALLKSLYLSINVITKRWTARVRNWSLIINELSILFDDRV